MDALVRLRLRPAGVWTTPWQADSLLGALAVAWARSHGAEALRRDLVDPWLAHEPPFVISDAFPGDSLPAPASLALPMWEWPREKFKEVKNLRWLSLAGFRTLQLGMRPMLEDDPGVDIRNHVRMRNSISRDTNTASGEGGELFPVSYSDLSLPGAGLTLYARATTAGLDVLTGALELLGRTGFGARASTGHGGFEVEGDPEPSPELEDIPDPDGFVSLSTFQPSSTDPVEGYWRSFVKYGKLAPEFHDAAVFKRPQVMLEPGACFRTGGPPRPFYGGAIGPERLLAPNQREALAHRGVHPVQATFALAAPMIWKNLTP